MRKLFGFVAIALLCVWSSHARHAEGVGASFVFPVSLSGSVRQTDIDFGAGFKVKPNKVNDKIIGAILRGENTTDFSVQFLDILHSDPSGRFFVYFDGRNNDGSTTFRVGTNPNGVMTTTLQGAMTQDGVFAIAGKYDLPMVGPLADAFVDGKVKFKKDTFEPTKITGVVHFVSAAIGEVFTVKFKTVGAPTQL